MLKNRDIVIVTLSEWDGPRRIRHHLANEFVKQGNTVLFVEGFYTLSKFIKHPDLKKLFRFLRGPREINKGLFLLATIPLLPFGEFSSLLSRINWAVARVLIRRTITLLGMKDPLLFVFAYNGAPLIGQLGEKKSIYFCNDAFDKLYSQRWLQRRVVALEREIVKKADAVITVSEKLTEERAPFAKKITTIHHGVDFGLFEESLQSSMVPSDLVAIAKPLIGYSGVVRHIIDLELLDYLAAERPGWSFVIVGPLTESDARYYQRFEDFKKRKNVHHLGSKPSDLIPRYITQFDVCLLPYATDEVSTYYAAPLKFYEYLAAGKPVVSTVGPYTMSEGVVRNAKTKDEFLTAIEMAFTTNSPEKARERKEIARQNSWAERVDTIDKFIETL
ncbi:MAG TPA: glycosyltransferase [Bacteroidota bacterium]|nr:glycosyltransferase [Bacteroidota bacterium]